MVLSALLMTFSSPFLRLDPHFGIIIAHRDGCDDDDDSMQSSSSPFELCSPDVRALYTEDQRGFRELQLLSIDR